MSLWMIKKGRVHVVSEPKCVVVKPFSYVSIGLNSKVKQ